MKQIALVVQLLAVCAVPSAAQAPQLSLVSGIISGTVKGADGSIVAPGVVSASRVSNSVSLPRNSLRGATVAIGPDGSFNFPPLVEGLYQVCAQTAGAWISPCLWGVTAGTHISISASQISPHVNIVLQKGAVVTVRVDDPGHFFAGTAKSGGSLLIGVSTDSLVFHRAMPLEDTGGRTYQVLVPFDRQTRIAVASSTLQVANANGALLSPSGNGIPVLVPSGQQPPVVTLKIVGVRP